jgi:glycosyltransferase involved in cell wall biosynthesis
MSDPIFSLIVPTINRTKELVILLESLRLQEFKKFEVIIIDQNQEDILSGSIASFQTYFSIKHLRIGATGASGARNAGIAHSSGQIITFPDDDCSYPSDLLQLVNKAFQDTTLSGLSVSTFDPVTKGRVARLAKTPTKVHTYNILNTVVEFGIFFRSELLDNQRFDENFGPGAKTGWWSDEGPDLVLRLIKAGNIIKFRPDLVIYHPNPIKEFNDKTFTRSYQYGSGRGRFLRKHNFPSWFVLYVFALYVAGIGIGIFQFNLPKCKYYFMGLKGRVLGYYGKI